MSIKYFPMKSVLIKGILNSVNESDKLLYKLCPITEFSDGHWNLCVVSLFYNCRTTNIKDYFSVSCNLVKAQKFSNENEVESYQEPLVTFYLESTATNSKKNIYFDKNWFHINSLSNELTFTLTNETNNVIHYN